MLLLGHFLGGVADLVFQSLIYIRLLHTTMYVVPNCRERCNTSGVSPPLPQKETSLKTMSKAPNLLLQCLIQRGSEVWQNHSVILQNQQWLTALGTLPPCLEV